MKKKIAIFQYDLSIGGIEKSLINLLNNLDKENYEIDLYILKDGDFSPLIPNYVNVIKIKSGIKKIPFFKLIHKINLFKTDIMYDISIDYTGYNALISSLALKVKARKKVIWIHNDLQEKYANEWKYRMLYKTNKTKFNLFDEAVCVSLGASEGFKKLTCFENKLTIIPNYINSGEIIHKAEEKINFNVDKKKYNFCCLGRLHYQKGYDLLFPIIKELLNERRDFHLYIIGSGKIRKDLESQVINLGLDNYITFLGAKKNPYAYLNKMDALIFNSRYEGQGMVTLEAKCLGLEVIMPKHLEKYCEEVKGTDNMLGTLASLSKKKHSYNKLEKYNKDIDKKIERLLGR